ncbi:sigma-70 family RNA polymerase sigma factor [Duganella sp. sic0402]|uniref:sigma-70 family RNA polymerase sigma factor n=1 Tax=Duganella sp. sic0402 TaxID=2854786 RepID=UPI001C495986|nr:sigma-70 family RNA polymerase sigma factor [Duganella sp. sic0402]MBV7537564.1 sigma-70 family RNA polymerase sigma factor [Duganella sp. sic0402]
MTLTLDEVFIAHRPQLRQMALNIVRAADFADDIMQDAYLRLPQTGRVHKPLFYCYQVVRNLAMDHFRHRSTEASYRTYGLDVDALERACDVTPERILNQRRVAAAIAQALTMLPLRTQRAFELHRLDELTQRDIAVRLGCSATLVNFMLRDAAAAVQDCRALMDDELTA